MNVYDRAVAIAELVLQLTDARAARTYVAGQIVQRLAEDGLLAADLDESVEVPS